jgi:hypothetical protein
MAPSKTTKTAKLKVLDAYRALQLSKWTPQRKEMMGKELPLIFNQRKT